MGDAQSIPVLGEVVTIVESVAKIAVAGGVAVVGGISGDDDIKKAAKQLAQGAGQSWVEYSEKNLIAGPINALVKKANGNDEGADRIMDKTLGSFEGFVDSVPVVGHVKGVGHYIAGDTEHGNKCMLGATRGAVVLGAGLATGGLGGGVALGGLAGVGSGVAYDTTASVIDTAVHDEDRFHGTLAVINQFDKTEDPNCLVDLPLGLAGDFVAGAAGAEGAKQLTKAREIQRQQNGITKAFERAQEAPESVRFDANAATTDTVQAARNLNQLVKDGVVERDGHVSTIARNIETNEAHQGYSARARADINVKNFEANGERSGFTSKTNARKSAMRGTSKLQELHPDVNQVIETRRQPACAEHEAFNNFYDTPGAIAAKARVVSVKLVNGLYRAVIRCQNCLQYAEAMGNVVTDLISGQVVPVSRIAPCIVKGCGCGAIAIATRCPRR